MFCTSCGSPLGSKAEICPRCRALVNRSAQQGRPGNTASKAVASTGQHGESAEYRRSKLQRKKMAPLYAWTILGLIAMAALGGASAVEGSYVQKTISNDLAFGVCVVIAAGMPYQIIWQILFLLGWRQYRKAVLQEEAADPNAVPTAVQHNESAEEKSSRIKVIAWFVLNILATAAVIAAIVALRHHSGYMIFAVFGVLAVVSVMHVLLIGRRRLPDRKAAPQEGVASTVATPTVAESNSSAQQKSSGIKMICQLLYLLVIVGVFAFIAALVAGLNDVLLAVFGVTASLGVIWAFLLYLQSQQERKAASQQEVTRAQTRSECAQPLVRSGDTPLQPGTVEVRQPDRESGLRSLESDSPGQQRGNAKCPFCASTSFYVRKEAGVRRCSECGSVLPSFIKPG